jgi:hypothetical protein
VRSWEAAAAVADRYSAGRIFLVGDSAHVMPPTGGFGGNTGIQDAYNIAWKLDAVLAGAADRRLLDTYDAERRPIADATVAQALARLQAWFKDPSRKLPPPEAIVEDTGVIFGYRYPAGAFVVEGESGRSLFENPRTPSGRPGSRAPHVIVKRAGERLSTIDVFANQWVLVYGPTGRLWSDLLGRSKAASLDVGARGLEPAGDLCDVDGRALTAYGIDSDGAVLIRPDGFIAWRRRSASGAAQADLDAAVGHVLGTGQQSRDRETRLKAH